MDKVQLYNQLQSKTTIVFDIFLLKVNFDKFIIRLHLLFIFYIFIKLKINNYVNQLVNHTVNNI